MKIFISFDYEGLGGVSNWKETLDNKRYNRLATEQINAFLKGFYENDKNGEVFIADSHALGTNLIYEEIIGNTTLIKGFPRKFYMVEYLDKSFDGVVFFGYHSPVGIMGNMDHTYSSSSFFDIFINDKKASEIDINALVASYFGVPILYVYTDDVTKNWIKKNISDKITIRESKKVISRYAAAMLPYHSLLESLYEDGKKLTSFQPYYYPTSSNYKVKIILKDTNIAYSVNIIPEVKKIDDRTVEFYAEDPIYLYKMLMNIVLVASAANKL